MPTAYLDYAATAPIRPEVRHAMQPYFGESFGNPSSVHSFGSRAHDAVHTARAAVAGLVGARSEEIVFTAGGTESINLALQGTALRCQEAGHLITSSIEHAATLQTARFLERLGWQVTILPVDGHGRLDPDDIERTITARTVLVSVMHANNEVGTVEPIEDIAKITRERGVLLHVDAVQSAGKVPIKAHEMGIDMLSLSAHKIGGPKGTGALFVRSGVPVTPLIHGGGQEMGLRSGTENVAGIVGFGAAALATAKDMASETLRLSGLSNRLADGVLYSLKGVHLTVNMANRLPSFCHLTVDGLDGHWLVKELSRLDIFAATGSACASGQTEPSHVLTAMGVPPERARGALRMTLGWATTADEIRYAIEMIPQAVERLRARAESGADFSLEYARDCRSARDQAVGELFRDAFSRLVKRRRQ